MKGSRNTVLVSGAGGFVGKHLTRYLTQKGIHVLDKCHNKQSGTTTTLDVSNLPQLLSIENEVDVVIHLAAKSSIKDSFSTPYATYHVNILGTLNMLELARQKKIRKFVYLSTYVYGQPKYLPIDENHPINPHTPYNKSKLLAEQLCQYYADDFDIDIVTLRPFYLYGADPKPYSFIYCALEQIVKKNGNVILSGELTRRDFLFIDDFLDLIKEVLGNFPPGYNVYNVGYGKSYTLAEVSEMLGKLLSKEITIHFDANMRHGDVADIVADITKVFNKFNWRPSTSLEEGLSRTVEHYMST